LYNDVGGNKVTTSKGEKRKRLIISLGGGIGISCSRQSNPGVSSVVDRVESLEEELAEVVVQSRSTLGANVTNNQINAIGSTINNSILGTRPDLSVTRYFEWNLAKKEEISLLLHCPGQ
jgi:hypothetical protein